MGRGDRARKDELLTDEELFERVRTDPDAQARVREALAKVKDPERTDDGITPEELPEFLREHG